MAEDDSTSTAPDGADTASTTTDTTAPPATDAPEIPAPVKAALRKANKEAETLRFKLKELEDRDKTEAEKATERLTQAEQRALAAEGQLLRLEVAAEKGLTPAQAKRLVGSTREELETDADELVASFPTRQQMDPNGNAGKNIRPQPNLRRQVPVPKDDDKADAGAAMNDWLRNAASR